MVLIKSKVNKNMKTICLRFSDAYAPEEGTINLHQKVINKYGFVWYGKRGCKVSESVLSEILKNGVVDILLLKSGSGEKYLATVVDYSFKERYEHPDYYKNESVFMNTWLKITHFELANQDILDHCSVYSTGTPLVEVVKKSMGGYFIIDLKK